MRIDKYLAASGNGSRSEVKEFVRKGFVYVNGKVCKDCSFHVDQEDEVCLNGQKIRYIRHVYYMLNKPAGYVSATGDKREKTVLDLFPEKIRRGLFPVGRLDKDSVGLLLLTDDGALAHRLMSPKQHVDKRYLIFTDDPLTEDDVRAFAEGITLSDGTHFRSAELDISENDPSEAVVTISEGKFHQIKRMVESRRNKDRYLKRLSVGALMLDPKLKEGMYRELTDEEIRLLTTI